MFVALGYPVRVETLALSDENGQKTIRIIENAPCLSTIEPANPLIGLGVAVQTRTLDSYNLNNVGLIKIDVEGHELAVLSGATETILKSRPYVIVEAEERHRPNAVATVRAFFSSRGYEGWFLLDGQRTTIEHFDIAEHQNPANIGGRETGWRRTGTYINNFVFAPTDIS
jgi:hypothetical protein